MMTIGSLGVTVAASASTIDGPISAPARPATDRPPKPGAAQEVRALQCSGQIGTPRADRGRRGSGDRGIPRR